MVVGGAALASSLASAAPREAAPHEVVPREAFGGRRDPIPQEAETGWLTVRSDPPAHVFIDDVDTASDTPLAHFEVKAGHHRVRLVSLDGKQRHTFGIRIKSGQEKRVTIAM